jgi:aldose 1-epimerase
MINGIDHNFVVDDFNGSIKLIGTLLDPVSGRKMEVYTDQPGVQIYTGAHFNGSDIGKNGKPIEQCAGIALETQIYPNSPNYEHFPNAILRPGETYKHVCIYKFC